MKRSSSASAGIGLDEKALAFVEKAFLLKWVVKYAIASKAHL